MGVFLGFCSDVTFSGMTMNHWNVFLSLPLTRGTPPNILVSAHSAQLTFPSLSHLHTP